MTGVNPKMGEPRVLLNVSNRVEYEASVCAPATGDRIFLEKSVAYLELPEIASRAHSVLPDAEVVVILRDPVERAFSNWKFSLQNGFEHLTFADCLTDEAENRQWRGSVLSPYRYLSRGRYWRQLVPWIAKFPNLHIVQFEKFTATNSSDHVITDLCKNLKLTLNTTKYLSFRKENEADDVSRMPMGLRDQLSAFYKSENQKLVDLGIDTLLWT